MTACAVATGLTACVVLDSGADSGAPPLRELVLLAGTLDEGGAGRQDGVGAAARLSSPQGLALDAQGNLFVADTGNQLLRKITPAGVVSTVLDVATLAAPIDADGHETVYSEPTQVAFDPQGHLHVALNQTIWPRARAAAATDPGSDMSALFNTWAVLRVAPDGGSRVVADPVHQAGGALPSGASATALVFDAQGSLYTAGTYRCTIFTGDTSGQLSAFKLHSDTPDSSNCGFGGMVFGFAAIALDTGGRLCFITVDGKVRCAKANGEHIAVGQIPSSYIGYRRGMVFDAAGNLYISSTNSILKLSPAGDLVTLAGNDLVTGSDDGMGTVARFNDPSGLALDREGNLFVADTGNHTIRKISPAGNVSTVAGMAPQGRRLIDAVGADARFGANFALAADGSGQVYVADTGHNVVRRIAPDGTVNTLAGAADKSAHTDGIGSNARFHGPFSIAVDADGNALASDGNDLRTISPMAEVRTLALNIGGTLANGGNGTWLAVTHFMTMSANDFHELPSGLGDASQPNGSFAIRRLSREGAATILLDSNSSAVSLLRSANARSLVPAGLIGDQAGRVVFTLGHAVLELSPHGELSLLAGHMTESGSADGTGALARFSTPLGLALDAVGYIYVADSGNHTIRKISPSGAVGTVLGHAGQPGISLGAAPAGLLEPRAVAVVPGGLVIASRQAVLLARP